MESKPNTARVGRLLGWAAAALLAAGWGAGSALAQAEKPAAQATAIPTTYPLPGAESSSTDSGVVPAGCSTCSGGLAAAFTGDGGCSSCGGGCGGSGCAAGCYPGLRHCTCCCNPDTAVGRFFAGLYECICCPDPCYEPHWLAVADSAFFVDAARPVNQMRIRYNAGWDLKDPDRAEWFWAREATMPAQGIVDKTNCTSAGSVGKGPNCVAKSVDHEEISLYTEAAVGGFGMFVEVPYGEVAPSDGRTDALLGTAAIPNSMATMCCTHSGFEDIKVGTKSVLLDCELLLLTFQFKTYIPVGVASKGLGTGHVSLEPSLLWNLKITPIDYIQAQSAYWIPIGGDQTYESPIWHNHVSFNHVLYCPCPDFKVVGTAEINEWTIFDGHYTSPDVIVTVPASASATGTAGPAPAAFSAETTIVSAGPGVRAFVCDKIDFGVGSAFALTGTRWEEELLRVDFRVRY